MTDELSRRELLQVSAASLVVAAAPSAAAAPAGTTTAAKYIVARLQQAGVEHFFGVPGATCDPLFAAAAEGLKVVVTSSDLEAGYAADGCARVKGLGAVAVTYGVGTMSLLPVMGGAYAERSPVLIFNGGPSAEDLRIQAELGSYFSHSIGREKTDLAVFREVTESAVRAEKAADVPKVVDAAIRTALTKQRPVYVEIPKHLWDAACPAPAGAIDAAVPATGEEDRLAAEILTALAGAKRPAVLLGIELQRYGLQDAAEALVKKLGLPWTTTLLAKSVIAQQTPGFAGVYAGERSSPSARKAIEGADVVLVLGAVLGRQYRKLVTSAAPPIVAANDAVRAGKKVLGKAALGPLLAALQKAEWKAPPPVDPRVVAVVPKPGAVAEPGLGFDEALGAVGEVLDETLIAITDTSLSMYPAADLPIVGRGGYVCNAVWQAIGFSVGAAVGVGLSSPRRPLVVCGDGGFQMTAGALSTLAQRKIRAIVLVLDNGHYGIEQFLLDPSYFASAAGVPKPYLGLNRWKYAELAKALGVESAVSVDTKPDLAKALAAAKAFTAGPAFIAVKVKPHDLPAGLRA